jgi:hypothetical protein
MQIRVNNKHILVCLLFFSLFLIGYINVLNTHDIISSDVNVFDIFTLSGISEHSSMSSGVNAEHDDFMGTTNTSTELSSFLMRQSQRLSIKTSYKILTAVVTAQVTCLIYYSKRSDEIYTQLNSSFIAILHEKDGMK